MNWKTFVTGIAVGAAAGYAMNEAVHRAVTASPESVLAKVKKAFKENGPIDGSWIQMTEEDYEKYPFKSKVYRGGISLTEDGEKKQYEFIADTKTGIVLDVYPI
ncbi:propeptide PepSY amd peptidase M4 [Heyndrickxia acidiproducens]|jgi:predicted small secreted protein|uniref:propeptide PepSY amd peptidase M4 n=1 Tax=Heyndrickxia acidiproducens TaxID=1121084 RepID=UPI00037A8B30|nr:propeptide PepSY amd peptidase M4 [Heyndrickxia acidiproducens]